MGDLGGDKSLEQGYAEDIRGAFANRLKARRVEIEHAALMRIHALSGSNQPSALHAEGLGVALSAAIGHGFDVVAGGDGDRCPVPEALHSHARTAARSDVSLDTVMRNYIAGNASLSDFVFQEAESSHLPSAVLRLVAQDIAIAFERLLAVLKEEYVRESKRHPSAASDRRAERVRQLLAGETIDTPELAYDLDGWHVGMVITGRKASDAVRELATALGRSLLLVQGDDDVVWAWLGGQRKLSASDFNLGASIWPAQNPLATGEPALGRSGWRLTHRQAQAALPVALRGRPSIVRYADVALLASLLQDDLLVTSLRQLYLIPLSEERAGGKVARETLRAYLSTERNASSAAALLGVSRRTVANRLQAVEAKLGRPLGSTLAGIEAALHLEDLDEPDRVSWRP